MARELKEKLKTVDDVITYLARKERRVDSMMVTKTPATILHWYMAIVPPSGTASFFVAPCAGTLKKVIMAVPGVSKERPLKARVDIVRRMRGQYEGVESLVPVVSLDVNLTLSVGDTIRVVLEDPSFTDVAVSALFQPDADYAETLNFAIEALEAERDERIRNAIIEIPGDGTEGGSENPEEQSGVDENKEPGPPEGQPGANDPNPGADPGPTG